MGGVTLRMPLAAIKHFLPMDKKQITPQLPHEELLQLKRWNHADHLQWIGTDSQHGSFQTAINLGETTDFMVWMDHCWVVPNAQGLKSTIK
jgi:hypothetical protein